MKKRKNSRQAKTAAIANRGNYTRIAVIVCVGFALILTEFLCLPMMIPKQIILTRAIHGDLISPPPETNSIAKARILPVPPAQPARPFVGMTGPPRVPGTNFGPIEAVDGYLPVGFDKLAGFKIFLIAQMTDPVRFTYVQKLKQPIPGIIKSLDNREVAVKGFMLPLKLENARVAEFLLMRNRSMCCFGIPLQINEWIQVRMKGDGVKSIMDQPLTVYGTLHVGEIVKDGRISSIYQMDGEKMDEPMYFQ